MPEPAPGPACAQGVAPRILAVRLDSLGDVLVTGPAIRALRSSAEKVDLLVSPGGVAAARLLPGVDDVLVYDAPWCGNEPPPVSVSSTLALIDEMRRGRYDEAVIFTSFHQSPLPMALLARLAGIGRVSAASEEYPGSLLDIRHRRRPDGAEDDGRGGPHEVEAALALAAAAGFPTEPDDDVRLQLRGDRVPSVHLSEPPYVVVHPGASVPSRALGRTLGAAYAAALADAGWRVVVTGGPDEIELARAVTPPGGRCVAGEGTVADLAGVLAGASAVVVGNTGPAHLAAAVGTPVVSLFTPVVPVERWAPWGVRHVVLGDQQAPCAGSRTRVCSFDPPRCLADIRPRQVVQAVNLLAGTPRATGTPPSQRRALSCQPRPAR